MRMWVKVPQKRLSADPHKVFNHKNIYPFGSSRNAPMETSGRSRVQSG